MYNRILDIIRERYNTKEFISLHAPVFIGNEKKYVNECIDSTFVSSVGEFVNKFEKKICEFTGAKYAVATMNGTAALHAALYSIGCNENCEVITQALTFAATANAISYTRAYPICLDSDIETMGLSPAALESFLQKNAIIKDGHCFNKITNRKIIACVPMHVFGLPLYIEKIKTICDVYGIKLIEDAAESLGSYVGKTHTGLFGEMGILSFNGNKIITTGGGGAIITNNETLAAKLKHLTTTSKVPHAYEFFHDEVGFNYRLPNLNAALGCAQIENLDLFLRNKTETNKFYSNAFEKLDLKLFHARKETTSNYWLNAIQFKSNREQQEFLRYSNENKVMTRPIWNLMTNLPHFKNCQTDQLLNAKLLVSTIVNIPSGYVSTTN